MKADVEGLRFSRRWKLGCEHDLHVFGHECPSLVVPCPLRKSIMLLISISKSFVHLWTIMMGYRR